jgi:hypothetical protein
MARDVHQNSMIRGAAHFIAVSAGLLFGALIAVALVWILIMVVLGGFKTAGDTNPVENNVPAEEKVLETTPSSEVDAKAPAVSIEVNELPEGQQKALSTFGFEGETITISDSQMQCAETAVGKERLVEIIAGDAPGPVEAAKLYGCKDE